MTSTVGSRVSIVAGIVLGILSLAVAAIGAFGLYANRSHYVQLGSANYRTDSYSVISEPYDWKNGTFLFAKYGTVRVTVTPADGKPAFVGLATDQAVKPYLDGVGYATALAGRGTKITYKTNAGSAPSDTSIVPWAAKATGSGKLTLRMPADRQDGALDLVAMNADHSPVVAGRVTTSVTVPALGRNSTIELVAGLIVFIGSMWLVVAPIRRRRGAAGNGSGASNRQPDLASSKA